MCHSRQNCCGEIDEVREQEIDVQLDAHQLRDPARDVRVAGEVAVDLKRERIDGDEHVEAAGRRRGTEHRRHQIRQVVGDEHLLERAPGDEPEPFDNLLARDAPRPLDLRQQLARAQDRPGDQVRKERDEQREVEKPRCRRDLSAIHVDHVADRHERVERDADRQQHVHRDRIEVPPEMPRHRRRAVGEEIEILEEPQHPEIERQAHDERQPAPRGAGRPIDHARHEEVDDGRPDQQSEKPPVPRRVEVVARGEQHHVLRTMRQHAIERVDDEKELDELDRVEDHQRPAARAARPLDSRNPNSASPTTWWPRGVRCTLR